MGLIDREYRHAADSGDDADAPASQPGGQGRRQAHPDFGREKQFPEPCSTRIDCLLRCARPPRRPRRSSCAAAVWPAGPGCSPQPWPASSQSHAPTAVSSRERPTGIPSESRVPTSGASRRGAPRGGAPQWIVNGSSGQLCGFDRSCLTFIRYRPPPPMSHCWARCMAA